MAGIPNVNTFHWHTVYVADFDVVNQAIRQSGSFPASFDYTDPATKVRIQGDWQVWQLSLGGSGALVQMQTVISSGTATLGNELADLADGMIVIQFELEQVLDGSGRFPDPTAKPGTGTPKALRFPTTPQVPRSADGQTVTVIDSTFPNAKPSLLVDVLNTIFQQYFNANLAEIRATFHVMLINEVADQDGFQWVKPSAISYAVAGPTRNQTLSNTAFGVLALVDGAHIGPLQEQAVDIAALVGLPEGANSAFVISADKITEHLLLPGAISTIQGSSKDDFMIDDSGLTIVNRNDLTWGNFQAKDDVISPRIKAGNFLMRMEGNFVHVEISNASYSPSPGITVFMNLEQDFSFKTVQRQDGKYVFIPDVKSFGRPSFHANVQVSRGLQIAELVIGVVGALAAVIGGISAVAGAFESAADTAVTSETEASISISTESAENVTSSLSESDFTMINDTSSESSDTGVSNPTNTSQVQTGGIFKSTQFRTFCGLTAGIAGLTTAGIAVAQFAVREEYDKIPAFDDFAATVLGASRWPALTNFELLGAQLRNSLVAGIKLT